MATLQKANPLLIPVPLIFITIAVVLCAFRWSRLIGGGVHFRDTFAALMIGLFVNNVLPVRIGVRCTGICDLEETGPSFTYSFSTVLPDRFFDLPGFCSLHLSSSLIKAFPLLSRAQSIFLIALLMFCIGCIILLSRESSPIR